MNSAQGARLNEDLADVLRWFEAARLNDCATTERMLAEGFWTEAQSPMEGMTALMVASSEGSLACAQMLALESDLNKIDPWGNTALLLAAAAGHEPIVEMLLALGANPEVRNASGVDLGSARARASKRLPD